MRRLRQSPGLRKLLRETQLPPEKLILPLFVRAGAKSARPVPSMPGVFQHSPQTALKVAERAQDLGISGLLLFGIPETKDAKASGAYASKGVVQQTVAQLKKECPELLVITDVCLCEYMSHGHCGVVSRRRGYPEILNDPTLKLLAQTALSHADAGADLVAPSDMMDGRVGVIRQALDKAGFSHLPIMSYAAKFASAFYSPFREAAESAPSFGDRRTYQMDPANALEAMREVGLDIAEGADVVIVKPALAYLDIIYRVKSAFGVPTAAFAVSGEYAMLKAGAQNHWIDEKNVILEILTGIRRAGADMVITYSALEVAGWLK